MSLRLKIERALDHLFGAYAVPVALTSDPRLMELADRFKIQIVTDATAELEDINYQALDSRQKGFFADLLQSEMGLYPPAVIAAANFERLVLCRSLYAAGMDVAGLAQMGMHVVDTLFLDADRMTKSWLYSRKCFHHELYHAIDYHDDIFHYLDPDWRHLNKEGFAYYRDPRFVGNENTDHPGFLTTYSMTSIHEDKAELYCHLIVHHAQVMARCARDQYLAAKVTCMKEKLHAFCRHYDEAFWQEREQASHAVGDESKHSRWLFQEMQEEARTKGVSGEERAHGTVTIKQEKRGRRTVWLVTTAAITVAGADVPARTFYSYNKLEAWLIASGCANIPSKEFLAQGAVAVRLGI